MKPASKTTFLVAALVALAIVLPAMGLFARRVSKTAIGLASADAVRRSAAAYAALERADVEKLSATLDALASQPAIVAAFKARDRDRLLTLAAPIFADLKARHDITHWYFLDPEPARTCFLRVHAPALFGDVVQRDTLSQAIATHQMGAGKELGKTAFALRVVKPLRQDGATVGYMELGEEIDHYLERMKEQTGDDFGLLIEKGRVDRASLAKVRGEDRWDERPELVLVDSTMWQERMIDVGRRVAEIPDDGLVLGEWEDGKRTFVGGAFPVKDASGHRVGLLVARHEITAWHDAIEGLQMRTVVVASVLAIAACGGAILVIGRRAAPPPAA